MIRPEMYDNLKGMLKEEKKYVPKRGEKVYELADMDVKAFKDLVTKK